MDTRETALPTPSDSQIRKAIFNFHHSGAFFFGDFRLTNFHKACIVRSHDTITIQIQKVDMLRRILIILKLFYLQLDYFLVGFPEEDFCIMKGNYFFDLGWYRRAIHSYKRALQEDSDPRIHIMLGYCYSRTKALLDSVQHYRKACETIRDPRIDIGWARSEFECGNIQKSKEIIGAVRRSNYRLDFQEVEALDSLTTAIEMVKKSRKDLFN